MPGQESETRELMCELTAAELLQRGDAMADAELRIEQLKEKRGELGELIKADRTLRRKLAGAIDSGKERRDVHCVWIEDYVHSCARLIRQDTGECVDTRALTAADRQRGMFEDPPARQSKSTDPNDDRFNA